MGDSGAKDECDGDALSRTSSSNLSPRRRLKGARDRSPLVAEGEEKDRWHSDLTEP